MTTSYHVSPNGPRLCRAEKGLCPYGRAGEEHFSNINDAERAYADRMEAAFGTFAPSQLGGKYEARMNAYAAREDVVEALDKVRAHAIDTRDLVRASAPVQNTLATLRSLRTAPTRVTASINTFEATMHERARTAPERRQMQADRVRAKTKQVWARLQDRTRTMTADAAQSYNAMRAAARAAQPETRLRRSTARGESLRVGDRLEGGLQIARLELAKDGQIRAHLRGPGGTWAGQRLYDAQDRVSVQRVSKRAQRGQAAGRRGVFKDSAFYKKALHAHAYVNTFNGLRGLEAHRMNMKAPMNLKAAKPLPTNMAVAKASEEQAQNVHSLAAVAARRPSRAINAA